MTHPNGEVRLARFTPAGLDRGRSKLVEAVWYLVKMLFFLSSVPWPTRLQVRLLRAFGAVVGTGCVIRPRVNIHFPWKLTIGNDCWIGEGSTILNLEPVTIQHDSALAHEVYLAAAGHNLRSETFAYDNRAISIGPGCWLASRVFVSGGVTVGAGAVCVAGAVVVRDVPDREIWGGTPARRIGERQIDEP